MREREGGRGREDMRVGREGVGREVGGGKKEVEGGNSTCPGLPTEDQGMGLGLGLGLEIKEKEE